MLVERYHMKMKISLPVVAAALVLLLMVSTIQGIRLDAESHGALSNHMPNKYGEKGAPSGEVKKEKAISEEKERAGHRLPDIHVDYYGPRGHGSRHN